MKRIIIIGGGPSGFVAGIFAKREDNEVIILERNPKPLKKLLMTGSGKCNYFNEYMDLSCYSSEDMDVVDRILSLDNIQSVRSFFDSLGLLSKEKNGYYYPYTFQAITIQKLLLDEAIHKEITIQCDSFVNSVEKRGNTFVVSCNDQDYTCDVVVLACGSKAAPKTGSTGKGYSLLKKFDHTIIEPLPALVQLVGEEAYFKDWDGIRAEVAVSLYEDGEFKEKERGEIQLTSYGLSGICIFNLSHLVSRGLSLNKKEEIHINFVPFIDIPVVAWLEEYASRNPYKDLISLLEGFLHHQLAKIILSRCGLDEEFKYFSLPLEEKNLLARKLSDFVVPIVDTKDFDSCQICSGGLSLKEIDPFTMESRLVPNLYVVGELLDMNGKCGGYNLTECWITGMLAGKSIGEEDD